MRLARQFWITAVALTMSAGVASAEVVQFQLDSVTQSGGSNPSSQGYTPSLPLVGSADIDLGTGLGTYSLPDYAVTLDIGFDGDDVRLDITGWGQEITAVDGSNNLTSTGSGAVACTILGGLGAFVCPTIAPLVGNWPPADGSLLLSSAVIDLLAQTIVITDNSSDNIAGTITSFYSWGIVPEPGTGILVGTALFGLGFNGRRQRA